MNFQFFQFPSQKISAFRADPNVPIPGCYTAMVIKLRKKKFSENFQFWPIYGGPNIGFFDIFGILRLFFFFKCRKIAK